MKNDYEKWGFTVQLKRHSFPVFREVEDADNSVVPEGRKGYFKAFSGILIYGISSSRRRRSSAASLQKYRAAMNSEVFFGILIYGFWIGKLENCWAARLESDIWIGKLENCKVIRLHRIAAIPCYLFFVPNS